MRRAATCMRRRARLEQSGKMEPAPGRVREARQLFADRVSSVQGQSRFGCTFCAIPASDRTRGARRAKFRKESDELGVAQYREKKWASQPRGDSRRRENPFAIFARSALDCRGRAPRIEKRRCARSAAKEHSVKQTASIRKSEELKIRRARVSDAPHLAALTGQLGYPATTAQIRKRLQGIKPASQNAVFVADSAKDGVIGWLHVSRDVLLESEIRAEVNGLVVAEGQRSLGAGARLLAAAEDWARKHGCKSMSGPSNVIRERAHKFYERNGFEHYNAHNPYLNPLS